MTAFLYVMFVVLLVNVLKYSYFAVNSDYPRTPKSVPLGYDIINVIESVALIAWCGYLIWR